MSDIERYVVTDDPDEWGDGPTYANYKEADEEAQKRGAVVVALTYEYADSETVRDYRSRTLEPDAIPADFEVQPIDPDDPTAESPATCGTCGLTWDDGKTTSMTPAPSARCPFEAFHLAD